MLATMKVASVFQIIGAGIMLIAIALFIFKRLEGQNTIKVAGLEIQLSTPSLLMLLLGAALFVFPYTIYFHEPVEPGNGGSSAAGSNVTDSQEVTTSIGNNTAPIGNSVEVARPGEAGPDPDPTATNSAIPSDPSARDVGDFPPLSQRADWTIRIQACSATKSIGDSVFGAVRPYGFHVEPVGKNDRDAMPNISVVYAIDQQKPFGEALAKVLTTKLGKPVATDEINIAEGEMNVIYIFAGGDCPGNH